VVPYSIIRDGDWKLIKRYEGVEFELYNLKNDLSEKTDLTKNNPEKVTELNNKLNEWLILSNSKLPIVK
jgi:arylsulfatase A-like enzyme